MTTNGHPTAAGNLDGAEIVESTIDGIETNDAARADVVDSVDTMIERYGYPHTWDKYVWFVNAWRLIADYIEVRVLLDIALRCPDAVLAQMAKAKFRPESIETMNGEWPGRAAFEYDWEGLTNMRLANNR